MILKKPSTPRRGGALVPARVPVSLWLLTAEFWQRPCFVRVSPEGWAGWTSVSDVDLRDDQPGQHEFGNRTYLVAEVEPLDVDGVRTVEIGVGVWLVAFVALLPFYGRLEEAGRLWWLWTCLAGFGLGLLGLEYCRRRRRAREVRRGE